MHRLTQFSQLGALLTACALTAACGGGGEATQEAPPTFDFKIDVLVTDTSDKPVVKAPVMLDGQTIGYTDKDGRLLAVITEVAGKEIELATAPPEGYAAKSELIIRTKLTLREGQDGSAVGGTAQLHAKMERALHEHLIWISLECGSDLPPGACADLEVKNDQGETIATTDPFGRAHVLLTGAPDKPAELTIDTRRPPAEGSQPYQLEPAEPSFTIEFGRSPEVFVIKQAFTNRVAQAAPAPTKTVEKRVVVTKPKTIQKPTESVTKPKPKDKNKDPNRKEVIQLF
jgi:hypothetical protein